MMISTPTAVDVPLRTDEDGTIRVGKSRVILDLIIYAFRRGETPETIVDQFPTLALPDVYLVVGYYLQNRDMVDDYIRQRETEAEEQRREFEKRFPPKTLTREMLLARLAEKQNQQS